jgi:stage V sporulation protein G
MVIFDGTSKMEISEVRVKLVANKDDRLKGFCSMTLDNEFVVRDVKVIEGTSGLFVAMPSRKMSDHCDKCGGKNHLRAKFCNNCGGVLSENRAKKDIKGRMKLHADIAHPINAECRKRIQDSIVAAFEEEFERSKQPGYKPVDLDEPDADYDIPDMVD